MSHSGLDAGGGEAVPSSSASSRRDGSDVVVPATPPVDNGQANADAAPSAMEIDDTNNDAAGASRQSGISSSPLENTTLAASMLLGSSQTIPDSQDSTTKVLGGTRQAPVPHTYGSATPRDVRLSDGQQLLELSTMAAAQQRADQDASAVSRKRMANGQVKDRTRSNSPIKGHTRSISAISMASTGNHIGDMSADLKTRLTYAMVKVTNGWQSHSLEEVESLASQGASPVSSNSPLPRRKSSSSTSPKPGPPSSAQVHFALDPVVVPRKSHSPPVRPSKPTLAPPAPIQPSLSKHSSNMRRNTTSRHPPALLTHSHSASAAHHSPRQHLDTGAMSSSQPTRPPEGLIYSPHQNVREQDAIETLLFMSSPGNSTNLKHAFSPSVSPAPQQAPYTGSVNHSNTAPNGYRKGLPGQRPAAVASGRKAGSPAMMGPPPGSPMELDSPQQPAYHSPNIWTAKRRANGASGHLRGALSLPSGLGIGNGRVRQPLRDEDIERILDRAANDSSDDDGEILLPARTNGVAGTVGI